MKIEVARIPESGITLREDEPPEIMGEFLDQVKYNEPIHVKVSAQVVGGNLVVHGRLTTTAVLECNRCLRKFDYGVKVEDYRFALPVKGDETIDLTPSVREDIILSLPMKRLCSPECKGLCPACGQDLNVSSCTCRKREAPGPFSQLDSPKS